MKYLRLRIQPNQIVVLVSFFVGIYGLFIIATTLLDQFLIHRFHFLNSFVIDAHLLFGIGFVYLSLLLARRKRTAFLLGLGAFIFLLGEGTTELLNRPDDSKISTLILIRYLVIPAIILICLLLSRGEFKVKSDTQAFKSSLALAVIVIFITLAYGIGGFMLMDKSDFRQELSFSSALHHTIDQFDLTTAHPLHPYTRRASLFMDSLSFVSIASVVFLIVSLVQPVRAHLVDQSEQRARLKALLERYSAPSEEFFKLWPHDKHYFFSRDGTAALAYLTKRGVALILADPVGEPKTFKKLMKEFSELCWANDWQPALIHVDGKYRKLYQGAGFQLQLIGQEAFVDIANFCENVAHNKYFRNISNRFEKENFSFEVLKPPHHGAVLERLSAISQDWLSKPGRTERGFVMGYYSEDYVQQCAIAVVRDAAQTIQAFLNIVPTDSFNQHELTYDMLRAAASAPPNTNDYLLSSLLQVLNAESRKTLSMGLSPLVGLDEDNQDENLISSVLRFAYVNGDRFYSFSGLKRFKAKYEPTWEDRYLGYKGGIAGFTKMLNALVRAMRLPKSRRLKRDS